MESAIGEQLKAASRRLADAGLETPRLDAEVLLAHVLGVGRTTLLASPEALVGKGQSARFAEFVGRRAGGEPVAYIRGLKEFYGLAFSVDERALIPRPETETLVGLALDRIREALLGSPRPDGMPPLLVWDVGTGSGAIVISVAVECGRRGYAADVRFLASDISPDALSLAVENAVAHGVADTIEFAMGDLTGIADRSQRPMAGLLLANLPYIPSSSVPDLPVAASFEPRQALDGGADGLELINRLMGRLHEALTPAGVALLEIGADQASAVEQLARATLSEWTVLVHDDLGGRPRVVEFRRGGPNR